MTQFPVYASLLIYGLVLGLFLKNSYREFSRQGEVNPLAALMNLLLCIFWPFTLLGFALAARSGR